MDLVGLCTQHVSLCAVLQELGKFLVRASNLLADLHQLLIPVTVSLQDLSSTAAARRHSCHCISGSVRSYYFAQTVHRLIRRHAVATARITACYAKPRPGAPCRMQMATAPEAIEFFMALFCNTTRIVLLMEKVPWKLLVQVSAAGVFSAHHAYPNSIAPHGSCMRCTLRQHSSAAHLQPQQVHWCILCATSMLRVALSGVHHCDDSPGRQLSSWPHCCV